jgi:uncharacterized protein
MNKLPPVLIYLHGFKSSPEAAKAREVAAYIHHRQLAVEYLRPTLPDTPDLAIPQLDAMMQSLHGRPIVLIGSSLGGYYATWLAERFDVKAVLVNPAVHPHLIWDKYIGLHQNPYSGVQFAITSAHIESLKSIYLPIIPHPERYLVLLQTGDEVLDALEASKAFYRSACIIEHGGDHRFQDFQRYLPHIMAWLHLE